MANTNLTELKIVAPNFGNALDLAGQASVQKLVRDFGPEKNCGESTPDEFPSEQDMQAFKSLR